MEMVHFIPPGQRKHVLLAAQTDSAPAIILGSTGTGKGAICRWIHDNGPRSGFPFIVAQRDSSLAEAATQARGGSLMIPEVGELPLGTQKLLLDLLDTRSIPHPMGNGTRMLVNVRLMVTSSHSLDGRAQGGLFNSDLLKKLNVFRIEMPDLVDRKTEFSDIASGILGEITRELHREHLKGLSSEVWNKLTTHDWPGNLRELRNVLRFAALTCQGDEIGIEHLPDLKESRIDFHATREEFEKIYLLELLNTFDWEIDRTCEASQMDRGTLEAKMKKHQLQHQKVSSVHPPQA